MPETAGARAPVLYSRQMIRMLDHTADVGFELEAPTLEGLFDEARRALYEIMFENPPTLGKDERTERRTERVSSPTLEGLLVRWINELVYLIQTAGYVPVRADLTVEQGYSLTARLTGVPLDVSAHGWQGEVKSATFHGLSVEHRDAWCAQVILDV